MFVGLFALALGWMCLDHVARMRALYSEEHPPHSRFHGEKPLMLIPTALGVLLVLDGLALLTLAIVERLQAANVIKGSANPEIIVAFVLMSISVVALVWSRRSRRNEQPTSKRAGFVGGYCQSE